MPELRFTQHITPGKDYAEQTTGVGEDGGAGRTTRGQASKRTDGRTEQSWARAALLKTQRSKSAKWSFSIYSHGFVVVLRCFKSHLNVQRIKGVMCYRKDRVRD